MSDSGGDNNLADSFNKMDGHRPQQHNDSGMSEDNNGAGGRPGRGGGFWSEESKELDEETATLIGDIEEELQRVGPNMKNAEKLLRQEIETLRHGKEADYLDLDCITPITVVKKVLVPVHKNPKFNFVGKLLGPGGRTLQQLTQQSRCKIYILGSGSSRTKEKEEEQLASGDPKFAHFAEPLHVRIECTGPPPQIYQRLGRLFEELKHYMIPVRDDIVQQQFADMGIPPAGPSYGGGPPMGGGQRRPYQSRGASRPNAPGFRGRGIQRGNTRPFNDHYASSQSNSQEYGGYDYDNSSTQSNAPYTSTSTNYQSGPHFSYRSNPIGARGGGAGGYSAVSESKDQMKAGYSSGGTYSGSYSSGNGGGAGVNDQESPYSYGYGYGGGGYVGTFASNQSSSNAPQQYNSPGKVPRGGRGVKPAPY